MRPSHSTLRTLLRASRVLIPCLLCLGAAASVQADPPSLARAQRRRPNVCDPRTAPLRKVIAAREVAGPVVPRSRRLQAGLTDITTRLQRASRAKLDDDAQAIQNDAPAAHYEPDEGTTSPLRPLGVLSHSFDRLPAATPFSPRSPRGPPVNS